VVDLIAYADSAGRARRLYGLSRLSRLSRDGVFVGEYETPDEPANVVDLAELVEDDPGPAAAPPAEC
jgi:hypothetical protein